MNTNITMVNCKRLIKISFLKKRKYLTKSAIAKEIGDSPYNPDYNLLMKELIDNEIITITDVVGNQQLLQIQHDKLIKYIDAQEITKLWIDYFDEWHFIAS